MIKLKELLKEESFTATNKKTGNTSVFKSKEHRDAAIKAGTHAAVKDNTQSASKVDTTKTSKKINKPTDSLPKNIYSKMSTVDGDSGEFNYVSTKDDGIKYGIADENGEYYVTLGTKDGKILKSFGKTKDAKEASQIFMKNLDVVKSKYKLDLGNDVSKKVEPKSKNTDNTTYSQSNPFRSRDLYNKLDLSWKDGYDVRDTMNGIKIDKTKPGKRKVDYSYQIKTDKDTGEAVIVDNKKKTIIARAKNTNDVHKIIDKIKNQLKNHI